MRIAYISISRELSAEGRTSPSSVLVRPIAIHQFEASLDPFGVHAYHRVAIKNPTLPTLIFTLQHALARAEEQFSSRSEAHRAHRCSPRLAARETEG